MTGEVIANSGIRGAGILCAFLLVSGLAGTAGLAQVSTSITSSGLNTQVGAPTALPSGQVQHDITGGTRAGTNLFHSFGNFNVATNHIANFLNNTNQNTTNILGRVNGGNPSNIFGTLQTTGFGNANLFLMNPAGMVFGPNASLNVGGSVHFSTADYLRLDDGSRFNAVAGPADAVLTSAPVAAFGFTVGNPAALAVQGSQLTVANGQTISLIGGQGGFTVATAGTTAPNGVSITNNSQLLAPEGEINIVSVGRPTSSAGGEVVMRGNDDRPAFSPSGFKGLGDVTLLGDASPANPGRLNITSLEVSGNSSGSIVIRGGKLQFVNIRIVSDTLLGSGGNIVIAGNTVDISATRNDPNEFLRMGTQGNFTREKAGPLFLAKAGSLFITGDKSISITGVRLGSRTDGFAALPSGPIQINAPKIDLSSIRFVLGGTMFGPAKLTLTGGAINMSNSLLGLTENFAPIEVRIAGTGVVNIENVHMNLFTNFGLRGSSIDISGQDINVSQSDFLTQNFRSTRSSGPVSFIATNKVHLEQVIVNTGFTSEATDGRSPGTITIEGKNITLLDSSFNSGVSAEFPNQPSPSGAINIKASQTFKSQNSSLSVSASGFAKGGEISIEAGKLISLTDSTLLAESQSASPAGTIHLQSGKTVVLKDSTLSVQNHGSGDAGTIHIQAGSRVPKKTPNQPNHDLSNNGEQTGGNGDNNGKGDLGTSQNGDLGTPQNDDQPEVIVQPGDQGQPAAADVDQAPSSGGPLKIVGDIRLQQSVLNAQSQGAGQDGQIILEAGKRLQETGSTITPDPIIVIGGVTQ